jgi:hypothetical protein
MFKRLAIPMLCMAVMLLTCNVPEKPGAQADPWPLEKGMAWVYTGRCNNRAQTCEMQVTGVIHRDGLLFATMHGYPADLLDGAGSQPSVWGLLVAANERYYRVEGLRADTIRNRLADPGDNLAGLVQEQELMFQLPLVPGKMFGETFQLTRTDSLYCWIVTAKTGFDPTSAGIRDRQGSMDQYTLRFSTQPDETLIGFVPGIGITSFKYSHHGTPAELDMKLTNLRR